MNLIPSMILKQLYTRGSLRNDKGGIVFSIKNRLSDAKLTGLKSLLVGDKNIPLSDIFVDTGDSIIAATEISSGNPIDFPLRKNINIIAKMDVLADGKYKIEIGFEVFMVLLRLIRKPEKSMKIDVLKVLLWCVLAQTILN